MWTLAVSILTASGRMPLLTITRPRLAEVMDEYEPLHDDLVATGARPRLVFRRTSKTNHNAN